MMYGSSDGAKSRLLRLERVKRYTEAILGLSDDQMDRLVAQLYDYKGQLNVVWFGSPPTDMQRVAFSKAWEMCGEPADTVFHNVDELWSKDV